MGAESSKTVQSADRYLSAPEREQLEVVLRKVSDDKQRITPAKIQVRSLSIDERAVVRDCYCEGHYWVVIYT